jgi:hypothetical protein
MDTETATETNEDYETDMDIDLATDDTDDDHGYDHDADRDATWHEVHAELQDRVVELEENLRLHGQFICQFTYEAMFRMEMLEIHYQLRELIYQATLVGLGMQSITEEQRIEMIARYQLLHAYLAYMAVTG